MCFAQIFFLPYTCFKQIYLYALMQCTQNTQYLNMIYDCDRAYRVLQICSDCHPKPEVMSQKYQFYISYQKLQGADWIPTPRSSSVPDWQQQILIKRLFLTTNVVGSIIYNHVPLESRISTIYNSHPNPIWQTQSIAVRLVLKQRANKHYGQYHWLFRSY